MQQALLQHPVLLEESVAKGKQYVQVEIPKPPPPKGFTLKSLSAAKY